MQWLRDILAASCGKPRAAFITNQVALLRQWLHGRVNFTHLEYYGG